MKSLEEQYISTATGNQLQSSDAAPEDARCTSADIKQKRLSSNGGHFASICLVKQSSDDGTFSDDCQVLQYNCIQHELMKVN